MNGWMEVVKVESIYATSKKRSQWRETEGRSRFGLNRVTLALTHPNEDMAMIHLSKHTKKSEVESVKRYAGHLRRSCTYTPFIFLHPCLHHLLLLFGLVYYDILVSTCFCLLRIIDASPFFPSLCLNTKGDCLLLTTVAVPTVPPSLSLEGKKRTRNSSPRILSHFIFILLIQSIPHQPTPWRDPSL